MSSINWDSVVFRASSWGNLLTLPRSKSEGELSVTCQKELLKIYSRVKYGRVKDITTPAMDKGKQCQKEGIMMFSALEGEMYIENTEEQRNEYFSGTPDMYSGESINKAKQIWDLKNSFEMSSFLPNLIETVDSGYKAQLNVYFDLCKCDSGGIVYTLISAPENILMSEKSKLLYNMNVISEISPAYLEAAAELERLLTFEDIDIRERCITFPLKKDEELIQKMKDKVPILRQHLYDLEKKHMNLYP